MEHDRALYRDISCALGSREDWSIIVPLPAFHPVSETAVAAAKASAPLDTLTYRVRAADGWTGIWWEKKGMLLGYQRGRGVFRTRDV